ncbi:MAG TPA: DUF309 domain-containing protein [Nitrososphaeraceae archaeon]|nr:DUF309 domain-containing protein [Nitrososphaeraceae archaeon]
MNKNNLYRYMVYLDNPQFEPADADLILKKSRELTNSLDIIIRDCRIASDFIELDLSIEKKENIDKVFNLLKKISSIKEIIEVKERHLSKEESIDRAVYLFNDEKYWWSHEALEMVWKEASGHEKQLLNGLILICAALVHFQKNENNICFSILERSMIKFLNVKDSNYYGINIDKIKILIRQILENKKILKFKI